MSLEDLIQRIGYFRIKKNLSARELSLRIGKSSTYINQIESKNFTLSLRALFEIIDALEITAAEFFAENYQSYSLDKEIVCRLNSLSPERKKSFLILLGSDRIQPDGYRSSIN